MDTLSHVALCTQIQKLQSRENRSANKLATDENNYLPYITLSTQYYILVYDHMRII